MKVGGGGVAVAAPDKPNWYASFGGFLPCVEGGDSRIELTGIDYAIDQDAPPRGLAVVQRKVTTADHDTPFISAVGRPPDVEEFGPLSGRFSDDVVGMAVDQPCSEVGEEFTELVFVVESGLAGARIESIAFLYQADDQPYKLHVPWEMVACGEAMERELCPTESMKQR